MTYLGKFATAEQIESLKRATTTPYIIIGGMPPLSPVELAHSYALAAGLPEFEGYYGCDLRTGEFVAP